MNKDLDFHLYFGIVRLCKWSWLDFHIKLYIYTIHTHSVQGTQCKQPRSQSGPYKNNKKLKPNWMLSRITLYHSFVFRARNLHPRLLCGNRQAFCRKYNYIVSFFAALLIMLRQVAKNLGSIRQRSSCLATSARQLSHYPINEDLFGTNEDQRQVFDIHYEVVIAIELIRNPSLQLRSTVFDFFQKELAPFAQEIDKTNEFT